jgi:hypothetical protein
MHEVWKDFCFKVSLRFSWLKYFWRRHHQGEKDTTPMCDVSGQ